MTSTFVVSFDLDTTDTTVVLGFEAWIDDKKFHDIDHVAGRQQILIEIPDDEAEHELLLIMKNKTIEHTQIDEAGNYLNPITNRYVKFGSSNFKKLLNAGIIKPRELNNL